MEPTKEPDPLPAPSHPTPAEPVDLAIHIDSWRIPISILIVLTATGFFIPLLNTFYKSGPPINSDIGVHYSAVACYKNSTMWSLPTLWCSHGQAGLARFQRYGILHAYITILFSWFMSFELAFKTMMVFGYFLLPLAAFLFLTWLRYPLAGSFAYTLILLDPGAKQWGGFVVHFITGGFINSMATGFSLLTIAAVLFMLMHPTPPRIVLASITHALYFLAHPSSSLWIPAALLPMAILYRATLKEHWRNIMWYPLLFVFFTSFWLIPAIAKSSYFNLPGLGGYRVFDYAGFFYRFDPARQILILFSFLCSFYLLFRKEKPIRLIGIVFFTILAFAISSYIHPDLPYLRYFTIDRIAFELRTFIYLSTALVFGGCWPSFRFKLFSQLKPVFLVLSMIILVMFLRHFYALSQVASTMVYTGQDAAFFMLPLYTAFNSAQGRVIAENPFLNINVEPISKSQLWSLSAAYSPTEFLGNSDFWYTKHDYSVAYKDTIFGKKLSDYTDEQLLKTLWRLNVQYIWTFGSFNHRLEGLLPHAKGVQVPSGTLYETPWEPSFLYFDGGNLSNITYHTTFSSARSSSVTGGKIFFKVRQWPNWHATIDGIEVPIIPDYLGLMMIDVPAGNYDIAFSYRMNFIDWLGYALTLTGVFAAIGWIVRSLFWEKSAPLTGNR